MFSSFESKNDAKEAFKMVVEAESAVNNAYEYIAMCELSMEYSCRLSDIISELANIESDIKEEITWFKD